MSRKAKLILIGVVSLTVFVPVWWFMESFPVAGQYYVRALLPDGCRVIGEDNMLGSEVTFFATPGTRRVEIDCNGKSHAIHLTVLSHGMQAFDWKPGQTDVDCYAMSD